MSLIPEGYPRKTDDEGIRQVVDSLAETLRTGSVNETLRYAPLVDLGLTELARRKERASSATTRRLSTVAIIVASLSLAATALFGLFDSRSDARWQQQQLDLLRQIQRQLIVPTPAPRG